jgi:Mrp family chromosome partitioning ATPase
MKASVLGYETIAEDRATVFPQTKRTEGEVLDVRGHDSSAPLIGLCSRLFLRADPLKVVAIVSCKPGEGATHVGRALRNYLALGMNFPSTLLSADECLQARSTEPAHIAGSSALAIVRDPTELLRLESIQNRVVLIDCPALSSSAAAVRLAKYVDGVLLIVEDGKRSRAEIDRAVSTIQAAQGQVLGVVLNKRRYVLPKWLYSLLNH